MKKLLLFATILMLGLSNLKAQETVFGISAGYNSLIASAKVDGISASDSAAGFYIGVLADIATSEKFHIQPELQFVLSSQDGESGSMLVLPVMGKLYLTEEFNVQFGPQLDLIIDDSEGLNALGVGIAFGAGYDISEQVFATVRYSLGLNNRLDEGVLAQIDPLFTGFDITTKFNFFQVGLGYRF